jgi:uncharacterized protein (TIGR02145 family)
MKTKLTILFTFAICLATYSQKWTNYTTANTSKQLCNNNINTIAIDMQGNKWIGTDDGVSKFDGANWTTYTTKDGLAGNKVKAIVIDAQGNRWFGTNSGISKFDGTNWTKFFNININTIAIDAQGNLWFGAESGISKYDGTNWTTYNTLDGLISDYVTSIAIDTHDNKWFGTQGGISKFDGVNWVSYTTSNGLTNNYIYCLTIDDQGIKWAGTSSGISKFDDINWTKYLQDTSVYAITIDAQDNKWFGTKYRGILKYNDTNWTAYASNGLTNYWFSAIALDQQGNKWLGTQIGGMLKFDGINLTSYTTINGLTNNNVYTIAIDAQDNIWFGTWGGGVSKFDGKNWTIYKTSNGLSNNYVRSSVIDSHGYKWFGTFGGGVSKFDGNNWTTYNITNGLAGNQVFDIAMDAQGNLWFGTNQGVSKFNGVYWTSYNTSDGLVDNNVNAIAIDSHGNKWIGTNGGGVSKFDGTNWTTYNTTNGLNNNYVNAIAIDAHDNIWIGIANVGISKFNGINWINYTITDGLASENVVSIKIDNQGNKWIGTANGLSKFDDDKWTNYIETAGLVNNVVLSIAIDNQGNKWFGTAGGVSVLQDTILPSPSTVKDADGNTYKTITIGNQIWMAENLRTTKYNDGTAIPNVTDNATWSTLTTPAYCWYNNDADSLGKIYGGLYNWYAVNSGNLCPTGFHVPTNEDWSLLIDNLIANGYNFDDTKIDDKVAKSMADTTSWNSSQGVGSAGNTDFPEKRNLSGFSGLAAGGQYDGLFKDIGIHCSWWSLTEFDSNNSWYRNLYYGGSSVGMFYMDKKSGLSVRCMKDTSRKPISHQITLSDTLTEKGKIVEIPISTDLIALSESIISYQFKVSYDSTKLKYTGTSLTGTIAEGGSVLVNVAGPDSLKVSYMNSNAITGSGVILKLQFRTLDYDTTYVNLSNFYFNATPVVDIKNSTIIIADTIAPKASISFSHDVNNLRYADTLIITATFTEPMRSNPLPQITFSGAVSVGPTDMTMVNDSVFIFRYIIPKADGIVTLSLSTGKDIYGNTLISIPLNGTILKIRPIQYGDVDDNNLILAYDAALTLQYLVGLDPLPSVDSLPWEAWRFAAANVDGIGDITAIDAGLILKYSAEIISSFPAGNKKSATIGSADVTMSLEKNYLIFRSSGDLIGFNLFVKNNYQSLEIPEILNDSMISVYNISNDKYTIGLATAFAPYENSAFMRIPIKPTNAGIITFDMIINTEFVTKSIDMSSNVDVAEGKNFLVYPNPVNDILKIETPSETDDATLSIFSIEGRLVFSSKLQSSESRINLKDLPNGIYMLQISGSGTLFNSKIIKQ